MFVKNVILALQALAQQKLGATEQALNSLEQALSLAEPEGYVRVDEGALMAGLLKAFSAQRSTSLAVNQAYVERLLRAFSPAGMVDSVRDSEIAPSYSTTLPFDALTDREMEVLSLLNTGLTGPEIARELYVSVSRKGLELVSIAQRVSSFWGPVHNEALPHG